jgi:hypothetical protein
MPIFLIIIRMPATETGSDVSSYCIPRIKQDPDMTNSGFDVPFQLIIEVPSARDKASSGTVVGEYEYKASEV